MPKLNKSDEPTRATARRCTDKYHVAFSVLAQGDNSPHMTDEFKQRLAEAKNRLAPYTIVRRGKGA